jgi:hypothetical protein
MWGCVDLREWAAVVTALPCWTEGQREAMGGYTLRVLEYPRAPRSKWHGLCEYDARVITVAVWPGQRGLRGGGGDAPARVGVERRGGVPGPR